MDLRVRSIAAARPLYDALLPALGLGEISGDHTSRTYYQNRADRAAPFFGLETDPEHRPNDGRFAFAAQSRADVDRLAKISAEAGARIVEGPELCLEYSATYYAVFFEDLDGNKFEICCRK